MTGTKQWRCVNCKLVTQTVLEPAFCTGCNGRTLVRIDEQPVEAGPPELMLRQQPDLTAARIADHERRFEHALKGAESNMHPNWGPAAAHASILAELRHQSGGDVIISGDFLTPPFERTGQ